MAIDYETVSVSNDNVMTKVVTEEFKELQQFRESLPITSYKTKILELVRHSFLTIICGETGCGKSTQIPQFLVDDSELVNILIPNENQITKTSKKQLLNVCVTQPRRMAAVATANRVAKERGASVGKEVGYTIRFDNQTSKELTYLKYVTDGIALREVLETGGFSQYHVLMIDEAHERSVNTDVVFALVKRIANITLQKKNKLCNLPFRVVITSATLNAKELSAFFYDAPILYVEGKTYPVEIVYAAPLSQNMELSNLDSSEAMTRQDLVDLAVNAAVRLHVTESKHLSEEQQIGHILVFLTGRAECELACQLALDRLTRLMESGSVTVADAVAIPLYGALTSEDQARVFQPCPTNCRKIIFSTNIAETSVTVADVEFVVDMGWVKQKHCNPKTGVETLTVVRIAKSQAIQRCGRAGRSRKGKCFRIYSEKDYEQMSEHPVLEILRTNLSSVVLQLKSMGCGNIAQVEFLDTPPNETLLASLKELMLLGALSLEGNLTSLGRRMVSLPLDPIYSKCLLAAHDRGVFSEVAAIVAMLSVESVWVRPLEITKKKHKSSEAKRHKSVTGAQLNIKPEAIEAHKKFYDFHGDHLTLLNVFKSFSRISHLKARAWCSKNFLQYRTLAQARDIQRQLMDMLQMNKEFISTGNSEKPSFNSLDDVRSSILEALCQGCFVNSARLSAPSSNPSSHNAVFWVTLCDGLLVALDRTSSLSQLAMDNSIKLPDYVIFHELIKLPSKYSKGLSLLAGTMTVVSTINKSYIKELCTRFSKVDARTIFKSQRGSLSEAVSESSSNNPLNPFKAQPAGEILHKAIIDAQKRDEKQKTQIEEARQRYLLRQKQN